MNDVRLEVNRHLFLGLFEYEAYFAKYEQGDFYQKHGGRLKMYDLDDNELATLDPKAGRLVVFLSGLFLHEVLPVTQQRFSIAGWF